MNNPSDSNLVSDGNVGGSDDDGAAAANLPSLPNKPPPITTPVKRGNRGTNYAINGGDSPSNGHGKGGPECDIDDSADFNEDSPRFDQGGSAEKLSSKKPGFPGGARDL